MASPKLGPFFEVLEETIQELKRKYETWRIWRKRGRPIQPRYELLTKKIVLVSLLLTAIATAGQVGNFEGTWMGLSGDLPQAATLVISLKDGVYSLAFTWANGETWQGRGYLVKGMLAGGFAYSEKDGGFFTVAASGANILMNTFNTDLTKRTVNGIYFKR